MNKTPSDQDIFNVITHGIRNMPSYAYQIPVEDRWAIVTWVRVLGRSQHGSIDDVPADQRGQIEAAE
jgi:mono/diheme cytochrome c family protein